MLAACVRYLFFIGYVIARDPAKRKTARDQMVTNKRGLEEAATNLKYIYS